MYHSVVAEPTPNTHGLHQNHCPKQSNATLKTHMNTARGMGGQHSYVCACEIDAKQTAQA